MQHETFEDQHGGHVLWRRWDVEARSGMVVLSHGASEHSEYSGRYSRFAARLAAAKFVQKHEYPGARHHLLNEINRHAVIAAVIGWLGRALEARVEARV